MCLKFSTLICSIGILLAGCLFFQLLNQPIVLAETVTAPSTLEIINQVKQDNPDVIYLGENHDSPAIHQQQLEIITQLQNTVGSKRELAIALEIFQRPFQPILDRYQLGLISEDQLRKQTEYNTRWGFDWEFYAPVLRFAQKYRIPLIALNTPAEITQKVAESGINSLEGNDFRYIPPLTEIKLDNVKYRQRLADIYQQHVNQGQGNSKDADNFFAAQVLWDETMAETIAMYHQNHRRSPIVVMVGKAHVMYDYAIANRVARRINHPSFTQKTFLLTDE